MHVEFEIINSINSIIMDKRKLMYLCLGLISALFFTGCSDKDEKFTNVDGQPPILTLNGAQIQTEVGREFTIEGKIEDKDGIRSIRMQNAELELDKTIDLLAIYDELQYSYDLKYKFKTSSNFTGDNLTVKITATDVGNRSVEKDLLITMDGDFTPPVFTAAPDVAITVLIKDETKLNLKFSVADDKMLDYADILIPELNYTKKIAVNAKNLDFSEPVILPSKAAAYNLTIDAVDKFGHKTSRNSVISVSEMPDFAKMYLTDVKNAAQLNSDVFGIPILIEHTAPYTYRARYYSEAAGTEVRFIPQKTDFNPICFGIDPDDHFKLTDEPDRSLPIVLPTGKEYYEITFNTMTGKYTSNTYKPSDKPVAIGSSMYLDPANPDKGSIPLAIGLVGSGLPKSGNWDPSNPYMLKQDPDNPYLFTAEATLSAGDVVGFIIQTKHSWGWWPEPFWRWDRGNDPESNVSNGGENPGNWNIKTSGKYIFKFDSHLLRSRFYPSN